MRKGNKKIKLYEISSLVSDKLSKYYYNKTCDAIKKDAMDKCRFIAMMCYLTIGDDSGFKLCSKILRKHFGSHIGINIASSHHKNNGFIFFNKEYKKFNLVDFPEIADEIFEEIKELDIKCDSMCIKKAITGYIKNYY